MGPAFPESGPVGGAAVYGVFEAEEYTEELVVIGRALIF